MRQLLLLVVFLVACGDDDGGPSRVDAGEPDSGPRICQTDDDCNDGAFCNGIERCRPGATQASHDGCVSGMPPRCDDGIECTEDTCSHLSNGCRFVPVDDDGDGHAALSCTTPTGELLGDDCDDHDPNRFPGNPETCTEETEAHDEDCNPQTFGTRDLDGDGATDDTCCNDTRCGDDCNDTRADVSTGYPEICDLIDNDCDGDVDVDSVEALWYPDDDRDGFGRDVPDPLESCAPVPGRSLFNTDLDDTNPSVNPAATEICDSVDNDSDARIDEGEVCQCGRPGSAPCECASGARDCFGGLIPRACIGGRWVAEAACTGRTPVCATGRCVCIGGGTACTTVVDRAAPFVIAASPGPVRRASRATVIAILFSEPIAATSITSTTFRLLDHGTVVDATYSVDGDLVTLIPDAALEPGRVYMLEITAVTDLAGNPLEHDYSFQFTTVPRTYVEETVGGGARRLLDAPLSLDTNDAGEALLAARYTEDNGDLLVAHPEVFARSSDGQWTTRDLTPPDNNEVAEFAGLGVNGTHYALTTGAAVTNYFRGPNDAAWTRQPVAGAVLASLAVGGDESCIVTTQGFGLQFHIPSTSGGLAATSAPLETAATELAAAGNVNRQYVAATSGNTLGLTYWQAPAGTPLTTIYGGAPTSQPSVALNDAGRGIATWLTQAGRLGIVFPVATQAFAFVDAAGADAMPVLAYEGGIHNEPRVYWLSDGAVLATRQDGNSFQAQRLEANGTLGPALTLGEDLGGTRSGEHGVASLGNGNAVIAWVHGASLAGAGNTLVVARYRNGQLEPTEIIADSNVHGGLAIAPLPGNRALLVWTQPQSSTASAIVIQ